jgi:hypothetical protein
MLSRSGKAAMVLALPLAFMVAACGDRYDERAALAEDELERELDLALRGDTPPATFTDTAQAPAAPAQAAPVQQPRQTAPRPQPVQPPTQPPVQPPTQPRATVLTVPAGTSIAVRLNETLSTETNSAGDPFTTTLTDPIIGGDGGVIIPSGAVIRGRVTAVNKSSRVGETAVIKLAFEAVSFGGKSYPLQASVVEANPERRSRTTVREQAAKVAAGAAAGAILGQIIGRDTEGTVKGAVIGAAAGTAIAMGTADHDAVLPSGSRMVIRLDAPVQVDVAG